MSKKKAFTGNTMTLKDFHGGSIPSDLPLPSAPGVIVKPSDRPGYDRSSSWGNSIGGRPDHRSRPNSSQSTRHFDDKTPFLAHSPHIGRNFDEDERKPLDGVSAPRRMVSDEVIQAPPSRVEVKSESVSAVGRLSGWQGLAPVASPLPSGTAGSYSGRVAEGAHVGISSSNSGPNSGHAISRPYPNAWAARKEVLVVGVAEPVQPAWSQESAVSKLAHASALEKVSSGRWQTKQSVHYQTDVEVLRHSEPEIENCLYNRVEGAAGLREYHDARLASHAERSLNIENEIQVDRKESRDTERARTHMINSDVMQPVLHSDHRVGVSELQAVVPAEPSERPKLKLLPRKKPLQSPEQPMVDHHQVYQRPDSRHAEAENESNRNMNIAKPALAGTDSSTQVLARPKLNLKPRSQPVETHQEKVERGRNALFGGARPREMVLRERGIDDVVIINNELGQDSDRSVKPNSPSTERVPMHTVRTRHSDSPHDQRMEKKPERKEQRADSERVDVQKKNWRSENWRNNSKEIAHSHQQQQERQPSPETWRKPFEEKPASPDGGGSVRHGKAASALELAQAFSRSVSDSKISPSQGQRSPHPGRSQMPFSRLTGPTPRPQINGY